MRQDSTSLLIMHELAGLPAGASAPLGADASAGQEQVTAKIALEDLFKDVWMADEEEVEAEASQSLQHPPDREVNILGVVPSLPPSLLVSGTSV